MKFKAKNRKDGTFDCWTSNRRKITGSYIYHPDNPRLIVGLSLYTIVTDSTGQHKGVITNYNATGYIDHAELRELVESVGHRAAGVERGDAIPDHVEQPDIRKSETWKKFLRNNPDFLKQNAAPVRKE